MHSLSTAPALPAAAGGRLTRIASAIRSWMLAHRTRAALHELDAATLRDIGLEPVLPRQQSAWTIELAGHVMPHR